MRPVTSGSVKSGASSEASAVARCCALSPNTQTSPRALWSTGRPRCRHSAARLMRFPSTNSRSRPAGNGTQTSPWHKPSGFASQPVVVSASRAGDQSASPRPSAVAIVCSPDSVSTVTMARPFR
jgi:hypothetical protein